jgi:hypothetical protein
MSIILIRWQRYKFFLPPIVSINNILRATLLRQTELLLINAMPPVGLTVVSDLPYKQEIT